MNKDIKIFLESDDVRKQILQNTKRMRVLVKGVMYIYIYEVYISDISLYFKGNAFTSIFS